MGNLLTVQEIIKEINISRATLYRYIDEGMPFVLVGANKKMFDLDQVKEFLSKRKDSVVSLVVGAEYTNLEICENFRVAYMGAIRKSNTKNALVLISYPFKDRFDYHDYWNGDILYFYGQGAVGDQELSIGYNKSLLESKKNGMTVYLFESFTQGKYKYRGIVELADDVKMETVDDRGELRNVIIFPLRLVNQKDYLSEEFLEQEENAIEKKVAGMSKKELVDIVEQVKTPIEQRKVISSKIQRNPYILKYARLRADGYCELCGKPAPFEIEGVPYLEADHIIPLSQGGTDSIDNVAMLCPNCNRRKGYIGTSEDVEIIKKNVEADETKLQKELKGSDNE